jgi:hypothetical protein
MLNNTLCVYAANVGCARPGPEAPDNAKPYACSDTAAGLSCSTTCQPGYSKVGSLSSLCKEGAWVKPTGNCTEDGESGSAGPLYNGYSGHAASCDAGCLLRAVYRFSAVPIQYDTIQYYTTYRTETCLSTSQRAVFGS